MHTVKIYESDTAMEIARKIYESFDVLASCNIYGMVLNDKERVLFPKGEAVLKHIEDLYGLDFLYANGKRKYVFKKDTIGGPIAHKVFSWEKRIVDSEVRYTIWRIQ